MHIFNLYLVGYIVDRYSMKKYHVINILLSGCHGNRDKHPPFCIFSIPSCGHIFHYFDLKFDYEVHITLLSGLTKAFFDIHEFIFCVKFSP